MNPDLLLVHIWIDIIHVCTKYIKKIYKPFLTIHISALRIKIQNKKCSSVNVAPFCAWSGEGSDHFGSYVHSLSLHFCKRLFTRAPVLRIKIQNIIELLFSTEETRKRGQRWISHSKSKRYSACCISLWTC
jgi:hypothetical protein